MLKSPIILLDEATSLLDSETEKNSKCHRYSHKNKTTIVIAHRLSTILNSDKIFVIEKGKY